ncbi:MAG: hypothetical protein SGCHY_001768 [Lobulomycetales sp.]
MQIAVPFAQRNPALEEAKLFGLPSIPLPCAFPSCLCTSPASQPLLLAQVLAPSPVCSFHRHVLLFSCRVCRFFWAQTVFKRTRAEKRSPKLPENRKIPALPPTALFGALSLSPSSSPSSPSSSTLGSQSSSASDVLDLLNQRTRAFAKTETLRVSSCKDANIHSPLTKLDDSTTTLSPTTKVNDVSSKDANIHSPTTKLDDSTSTPSPSRNLDDSGIDINPLSIAGQTSSLNDACPLIPEPLMPDISLYFIPDPCTESTPPHDDFSHEMKLLQRYHQHQQSDGDVPPPSHLVDTTDAEAYTPNPLKTFKKFQRVLGGAPTQCIRYEKYGQVLLFERIDSIGIETVMYQLDHPPRASSGSGGLKRSEVKRYRGALKRSEVKRSGDRVYCRDCGGVCSFEFQVTPYSLLLLQKSDANALDFATIAVYTCDAECGGFTCDAECGGYTCDSKCGGGTHGWSTRSEAVLVQREVAKPAK